MLFWVFRFQPLPPILFCLREMSDASSSNLLLCLQDILYYTCVMRILG